MFVFHFLRCHKGQEVTAYPPYKNKNQTKKTKQKKTQNKKFTFLGLTRGKYNEVKRTSSTDPMEL